ncbi:FAD-dependent oxidoreductase [Streptomyces tritici]|uniref:FAD-dependent oxidoreductase n=1 Tax=Streptomyces tritici TaxID=2054410 RepID=UPI003AEF7814
MAEHTDVVVIGGGYAGVMAANRLTQRADVTVTVINPRRTFVPRLRLHQLVAGTHEAVVDYAAVLADDVRLVVDTVTRIDAAGRRVTLSNGDALAYDYLIYAAGSGSTAPQVPGAGKPGSHSWLRDDKHRRTLLAARGAAPAAPTEAVADAGAAERAA